MWSLLLSVLLAAEPAPLTDEELVRRHVGGAPLEELLGEVAAREPAFDLSPEMLAELRAAGLPSALIEAMQRRQTEMHPPQVVAPSVPAPRPVVRLQLASAVAGAPPPQIAVRRTVPSYVLTMLELPPDTALEIGDLALYVVDLTPDQVPDHWRAHSPLGQDFVSMPRHRMLEFVSGARAADDRLQLDLPPALDIPLDDPEQPHDLAVGLAVRLGDRYFRLVDAAWGGVVPSASTAAVALVVSGGPEMMTLELRLEPVAQLN